MDNKLPLFFCLSMVISTPLFAPASTTKKDTKEMSEELERASKLFRQAGQLAGLVSRVTANLPKGSIIDLVEPSLGCVVNTANLGGDIIKKVGGGDKNFDLLLTRINCLLNNDDKSLKAGKDDKCVVAGCVDIDTCFALTMHDVVIQLEPFFANVIGKQELDATGKPTGDIEAGLFMNIATIIIRLTDLLSKKGKSSSDNEKVAAIKGKLTALGSPLESIKKLAEDAQKVLILMAKMFQPLPEAFTIAAGIISDKAFDYIDIPPAKKNKIKDSSVTADSGEFDFGDTVFDKNTIESDFAELV